MLDEYQIRVAPIRGNVAATFALWDAQWAEQHEAEERGFGMNPRLDWFLSNEDGGWFKYIGVFHGDELVGHFGMTLGPCLNSGRTIAGDEFFFIDQAHRKGLLGVRLIKFARDLARELGAAEFVVSYRTFGSVDLDSVLRRCKLRHTANVYSISFLGENHGTL
jgi:GNAT superfamily N-acetyltransferase